MRWAVLLLPALAASAGCGDAPSRPLARLSITGSSTMAPLVAAIGKRFEARHPGIRVDVQTGGSSRGVADTRSGLAHVGMVSRALHAHERRDLVGTPIARDGIALIVHAANPVDRLTARQVADLYTGRVTNWRDVSGADAPVVVVNKAEGRATLEVFLRSFRLANSRIRAHVVIGDNEQGLKTVAGNPHAIGYVSVGSAAWGAGHGAPIKRLSLAEAGGAGARPALSRPLTLVTTRRPAALARTFIDFAASSQARDLVATHYFVPLAS